MAKTLVQTGPWTCPSCKSLVLTPFCPNCGENPLQRHDLTLRGLFHQIFEALTNVDSRLIRSFRYLASRPGALTAAYLVGQRKPYIGPVPLFLLANVIFFASESITGGKVFTTPQREAFTVTRARHRDSLLRRAWLATCGAVQPRAW